MLQILLNTENFDKVETVLTVVELLHNFDTPMCTKTCC